MSQQSQNSDVQHDMEDVQSTASSPAPGITSQPSTSYQELQPTIPLSRASSRTGGVAKTRSRSRTPTRHSRRANPEETLRLLEAVTDSIAVARTAQQTTEKIHAGATSAVQTAQQALQISQETKESVPQILHAHLQRVEQATKEQTEAVSRAATASLFDTMQEQKGLQIELQQQKERVVELEARLAQQVLSQQDQQALAKDLFEQRDRVVQLEVALEQFRRVGSAQLTEAAALVKTEMQQHMSAETTVLQAQIAQLQAEHQEMLQDKQRIEAMHAATLSQLQETKGINERAQAAMEKAAMTIQEISAQVSDLRLEVKKERSAREAVEQEWSREILQRQRAVQQVQQMREERNPRMDIPYEDEEQLHTPLTFATSLPRRSPQVTAPRVPDLFGAPTSWCGGSPAACATASPPRLRERPWSQDAVVWDTGSPGRPKALGWRGSRGQACARRECTATRRSKAPKSRGPLGVSAVWDAAAPQRWPVGA